MNKIFSLRGFQLLLIILISLSLGYFFGVNKIRLAWQEYKPIVKVEPKTPPATQSFDTNLLFDVLDKVNKDYYDKTKIDGKKLLYGAISGMLQSLDDPYTAFFPPKENASFKTQLSGQFEGIGAELGVSSDNRISVVAPLDDSPAQKAGVRSGDIIVKVDGKDTTGWTLPQAVEKIRGPKGTKVVLTVLHEKEKTPLEIGITRNVIQIKSVTGWVKTVECKDGTCRETQNCSSCSAVAYIRLSQFGEKTNDEWVTQVNLLSSQIGNKKNFKGIILDVRNNPGGLLQDAVFIASEFLKSGVVVIQEDAHGERASLSISRRGLLTDYPLIVLINKGSASASEIVAGAFRDLRRAKLIGERTFGKGTIQQPVDVDAGASVHISVAKWLTPNGNWIDKSGLEPDVRLEYDATKSADTKKFDNQLQRAIQELVK